ncbi:CAP domain-containing protein [Clostridium sp. BJN0013]|uniref:CAP domain-containing protein n=1 Tax=Clostridium sp. BJN0013 TaxID=3236840 RepID=UPI0034C67703
MNKKIKFLISTLIIAAGIPTIIPTMAKATSNTCNNPSIQQVSLKCDLNNLNNYSQFKNCLKNCTVVTSKNACENICKNNTSTTKPSTNNNQTSTTKPAENNGQTSTTPKPAENSGQASTIDAEANEVIRLVNVERSKNGLSPLNANAELSKVATAKAQDMIDNSYFSHTSPTYGSPFDMMKKFGISYTAAGENIAYGQKNAAEVMNSWMNSPGHRANILNSNFTEIGVGVAKDKNGTPYWVQMFINPGK